MKKALLSCSFVLMGFIAQDLWAQPIPVAYAGAMRQLHHQGITEASIALDTLNKTHLYAIGPVAGLQGEIFVWDGRAFVAKLTPEERRPMVQKDVPNLGAIFLVYAHVAQWDTIPMAYAPATMQELEKTVALAAAGHGLDTSQPFPFLILCTIRQGSGHIIYADSAVAQASPELIEKVKYRYPINGKRGQLLGFYSQHHQGVFTHKDSFIHVHFRLLTKYEAGHLDEISIDPAGPALLMLPHWPDKPNAH